jgi:hypothetical protein
MKFKKITDEIIEFVIAVVWFFIGFYVVCVVIDQHKLCELKKENTRLSIKVLKLQLKVFDYATKRYEQN